MLASCTSSYFLLLIGRSNILDPATGQSWHSVYFQPRLWIRTSTFCLSSHVKRSVSQTSKNIRLSIYKSISSLIQSPAKCHGQEEAQDQLERHQGLSQLLLELLHHQLNNDPCLLQQHNSALLLLSLLRAQVSLDRWPAQLRKSTHAPMDFEMNLVCSCQRTGMY